MKTTNQSNNIIVKGNKPTRDERQKAFNKVWQYFVVEGHPFECVDDVVSLEKGTSTFFPHFLGDYARFSNAWTAFNSSASEEEVVAIYEDVLGMVEDNVITEKTRDYTNRKAQRFFRKNMKYRLIHYAVKHNLTIDGEVPRTVHARRNASRWKK